MRIRSVKLDSSPCLGIPEPVVKYNKCIRYHATTGDLNIKNNCHPEWSKAK